MKINIGKAEHLVTLSGKPDQQQKTETQWLHVMCVGQVQRKREQARQSGKREIY